MMASVLETLYILFKGDTSDLKRSTDDALNSTKKLTGSIKSIDDATEKVGKKFMAFASQLAGAVAAFASIHGVIGGLSAAVSYDIELGNSSRALGVNVEQLDAWDNAVQKTGGTAQGFQGSLRGLAEHFHTTAKVAMQALPQLADVFSHISRYSAFNYGKAIGLDEPTILLLQQGRREVESFLKKQKELGLVTQEQVEVSRNYNNSIIDLKHSLRTLFNEIAIPALPAITKFFDIVTKGIQYLIKHKDLVVGALTAIATVMGIIVAEFVIANAAIFLTIAIILLLIGVVALAFEDISTYLKGGKSLLGEYVQEWKDFFALMGKGWDYVKKKVLDFLESFKLIRDALNFFNSNKELNLNLLKGKSLSDIAANSAINSQTSNSIFNASAFTRNASINTGPITVNTQATDAVGVSQDLGLHFKDHFALAANYFADNTYA